MYDRYALGAGAVVQGPAIVEEIDSTTVVHPQYQVRVDEVGQMVHGDRSALKHYAATIRYRVRSETNTYGLSEPKWIETGSIKPDPNVRQARYQTKEKIRCRVGGLKP